MDRHFLAGSRHSNHVDFRSRLRSMRLCLEGRARGRGQKAQRAQAQNLCRSKEIRRGYPPRVIRVEDDLLHAGLYVDEGCGQRISMEFELRWHRAHVARWLYYPKPFPGKD